jgi:hypothetical protein
MRLKCSRYLLNGVSAGKRTLAGSASTLFAATPLSTGDKWWRPEVFNGNSPEPVRIFVGEAVSGINRVPE